jgi:hypothetical protein
VVAKSHSAKDEGPSWSVFHFPPLSMYSLTHDYAGIGSQKAVQIMLSTAHPAKSLEAITASLSDLLVFGSETDVLQEGLGDIFGVSSE